MAITSNILFEQQLSTREAVLNYKINGTDSLIDAYNHIKSNAPSSYNSIPQSDIQVTPQGIDWWFAVVRYSSGALAQPKPTTSTSAFSLDTTGGTQHIIRAIQTTAYAPSGGTAPEMMGAINQTTNGIDGVDITMPVCRFTQTLYYADSAIDSTYMGKLFRLTGKVNDDTFTVVAVGGSRITVAAGECLFLGASVQRQGANPSDLWEITLNFTASPNATGLTVGAGDSKITGINKKGFEYLWVYYDRKPDENNTGFEVWSPLGAYVAQVYEEGDFSDLYPVSP